MSIVTAVLGSFPLSIGKKLRQIIYRRFFAHMGRNVLIECGVEWVAPQSISLGHNVQIGRNGRFDCWLPNSKIIIRDGSQFSQGVEIVPLGGTIEIGEDTNFGSYICMAGPGNISIGKNCLIASHCGIYANNHGFDDLHRPIKEQELTCEGIVIEEDCWLGTGVRVLDGVTIGRGSVIGAGAVVTKDIPPYSVAVGVPAKVISSRRKTAVTSIHPETHGTTPEAKVGGMRG